MPVNMSRDTSRRVKTSRVAPLARVGVEREAFLATGSTLHTMARGIIGTLQLVGTVVLAAPLAILGVQFLLSDRLLMGGLFVGLAVAMLLLEEYLTTPQDLPAIIAERAAGRVAGDEEERRSE
jgi:hypothetical protein